MLDLPIWIKKNINKLKCPNCDAKITRKNIINIGLTLIDNDHSDEEHTKEHNANNSHTHVYIGCICKKCNSDSGDFARFEFILDAMSMEEFVFTMMEQYMEEEEKRAELEEDMDEFEEEHNIKKVPYKKRDESKPKSKKKEITNKSKITDGEVSNFIKD